MTDGQDETTSERSFGTATTVILQNADALREYLDGLNESGIEPSAVGFDSIPRPFFIVLVGCYADGEVVITDSPCEHDYDVTGRTTVCDECVGWRLGIGDLHYPVRVMEA